MVTIKRIKSGVYNVLKNGIEKAKIRFVSAKESAAWPGEAHWALEHCSGRVDRHPSLELAKDDALKI